MVTPNEYRSERWSTARFILPVCSGDLYGKLPWKRSDSADDCSSLDSSDAGEVLPAGRGHDGHFVSDRLAVAVGVEGVHTIDFGSA